MVFMAVLLLSCFFTPTVSSSENFFRQTDDNNSTRSPTIPTPEITKDFAPFVFDMKLNVTNSVDFNDLLTQLNNVIEFYIFDRLFAYGLDMESVTIRAVTLQVTLLVRRRQLRMLQRNTQEVTIEVDGATHYEVDITQLDLDEVKRDLLTEVDSLLTLNNVGKFIMDSNVDDVVQIKTVSINDVTQSDDQEKSGNNTGNQSIAPDDDDVKKPSTLAMVFGFVLLFLTILSLFGYVYMFQQKRQKRLMRMQRLKQKVPPKSTRKVSPNQQIFPQTPQQKPLASMNITPVSPSSSENFSFQDPMNMATGAEDDNKVVDSFAEELEAATSRDQQEWETARQSNSAFDGNFVDMNGENKTSETGTFEPYSPYGDGARAGGDFGLDDVSNWEPYGPPKAEEKKEDAWGTASAFSMASIPASAFSQEGFEMNLSSLRADNSERASIASSEASSMMQEVQKLSKYVQRYEKRKERKVQREKERTDKSDDGALDLDYLQNLKSSLNQRSRNKVTRDSYPSFDEGSNARSATTLKQAGASLTSQLLGKSRTPPASHRLGRSSFKDDINIETVQEEEGDDEQPQPRNIFPDETNSQPARRRAKSDGDRPQYNFSKPRTSLTSLRGYQAVMENKKKLAALRSNTAIIDSSKSDVNIGGFNPSPGDDQPLPSPRLAGSPSRLQTETPNSRPVATPESTGVPVRRWTPSARPMTAAEPTSPARRWTPNSKPAVTPEATVTPERRWSAPKQTTNSNSKFSSARKMFEQKPQNAVFPPGQRLF